MIKKLLIPGLAFFLISAVKDTTSSFNVKELENSLSYIPVTSCNFPPPTFSPENTSEQKWAIISEKGFYISKYEVSNGQYLIYLRDLMMNGKKEEYTAALPDTLVWRHPLAFQEPYVEYYFRHPAYRDYPVVGVTYDQSKKYCEWLTQRYAKESKCKYPKAVFKLPTEKQWYVAACGGSDICIYPWGPAFVRNKKGEVMANFKIMPENSMYRDPKTGELKVDPSQVYADYDPHNKFNSADITAPVNSYFPNEYGLHNMAGNVEEFVMEKGITKGGSWKDPAYYLQNFVEEKYDTLKSASSERGFRVVMEVPKQTP